MLPHTSGDADPTSVLPNRGGADPTAMLPPVPQHQPGGQGDDPHPWQNQMRAARDRNEQTQVQYLDPNEDPLRRRPQRQVARPQQQPRRQNEGQPQQGYGHPRQQEPQQYAPRHQEPRRYAPAPQQQPRPQRYANRSSPRRAPRASPAGAAPTR